LYRVQEKINLDLLSNHLLPDKVDFYLFLLGIVVGTTTTSGIACILASIGVFP